MHRLSRFLSAPALCALLAACGSGAPTSPNPAPSNQAPPGTAPPPSVPAGGPPAGAYGSCLLLTLDPISRAIVYIPSLLGTVVIGPGNAYSAPSYPGQGTYTFNAAKGWVAFVGGPLDKVNAAYEHSDGKPLLRFGDKLADPAPDLEIGENICYGP